LNIDFTTEPENANFFLFMKQDNRSISRP